MTCITQIFARFPCIPADLAGSGARFEQRQGSSACIIYGLPFADYLKIKAHSSGALKTVALQSLMHHKAYDPTLDKPAWTLGRAAHCRVLEPDEYDSRFATWTVNGNRRGRDKPQPKKPSPYSRASAEWYDCYPTQEALLPADTDAARMIGQRVHGHPFAGPLLRGGHSEVTIIWERRPGEYAKVRLDYLSDMGIADLKSTSKPMRLGGEGVLCTEVARMGYHLQAAFYSDAAAAATGLPLDYRIVFVGSAEPHPVAVLDLLDGDAGSALTVGRELYEGAIESVTTARETGEYPGPFDDAIIPCHLPEWAQPLKADYSGVGVE